MKIQNPMYNQFIANAQPVVMRTKSVGAYDALFELNKQNNENQICIRFHPQSPVTIQLANTNYRIVEEFALIDEMIDINSPLYRYNLELHSTTNANDIRYIMIPVSQENAPSCYFDLDHQEKTFVFGQALELIAELIKSLKESQKTKALKSIMYEHEVNLSFAIQKDLEQVVANKFKEGLQIGGIIDVKECGNQQYNLLEWLVHLNSPKSFRTLVIKHNHPTNLFIRSSSPLMRIAFPGYEHFYGIFAQLDESKRFDLIAHAHRVLKEDIKTLPEDNAQFQFMNHQLEYLSLLYQVEKELYSLHLSTQNQTSQVSTPVIPTAIRDIIYSSEQYLIAKNTYMKKLISSLRSSKKDQYKMIHDVYGFSENDFKNLNTMQPEEVVDFLVDEIELKSAMLLSIDMPSSSISKQDTPSSVPVSTIKPPKIVSSDRIIDLIEQYQHELEEVEVKENDADYTVSILSDNDSCIDIAGKNYKIDSKKIIIYKNPTSLTNHYTYTLKLSSKTDDLHKVLAIDFDANDRPTTDQGIADADVAVLLHTSSSEIAYVINTLRIGANKQRVKTKDFPILTMFIDDIHLEFEQRASEFFGLEPFKIQGQPEEHTFIEWAFIFGSIRIFKSAIEHGFVLFPCHKNSPLLNACSPGYDDFFSFAHYHDKSKNAFEGLTLTIKNLIDNKIQKLSASQPQFKYYKAHQNLIANLIETKHISRNKFKDSQWDAESSAQMLVFSRVGINKEVRKASTEDYYLLHALGLFAAANTKLYALLSPQQIKDLKPKAVNKELESLQDSIAIQTALLEPSLLTQIKRNDALIMKEVVELIYDMVKDGCYQGMQNGELIFKGSNPLLDQYRERNQNIVLWRNSLISDLQSQNDTKKQQKKQPAFARHPIIDTQQKKDAGPFLNRISETLLRSVAIKPSASAFYKMAQQYSVSRNTELDLKTVPVPFTLILTGQEEQRFNVPVTVDIQLQINYQNVTILSHSISIFATPLTKEQSCLYVLEYQSHNLTRKCLVYFDNNLDATSVQPSKLPSHTADNLRVTASSVLTQVLSIFRESAKPVIHNDISLSSAANNPYGLSQTELEERLESMEQLLASLEEKSEGDFTPKI